MQLSGHLRQLPLWRSVTRFEAAKTAPDIAIRNTIGIVLPLAIGAAVGYPSTGVVAALGALNVSYSDSHDPYVARARRMFRASVMVGLAVALGSLAGHTQITTILAAMLWAFGAGILRVLGTKASDLGVTTLVTLVVFAARPLPVVTSLEFGLVAFAGGLLQMLLSIAVWPLARYRPEREIIAALYRTLSTLASSAAGPDAAPPGSEEFTGTQAALASLAQDHSVEAERYTFLFNQAERIRLTLLTLRRLRRRIQREREGSEAGEASTAIDRILAQASAALDRISRSALQGKPAGSTECITEAARLFREQIPENAPPFLSAQLRDASHHIDALAGQLRAAASLSGDIAPSETQEPWRLRFSGTRARVRANLSFRSTLFRHAVRLAVCMGVGEAIALSINVQRSYWLPMTMAIVLRPDFTATFSRGILRIAGTLAGLLLATALFHFLHTGPGSDVALCAVFAFLLRWVGPANYGIFVTALSSFVVLMIAITGVSPKLVIEARAFNTLIGGALALVAYRLWPTWERTQVGPVLADLMEAYQHYFHTVASAYAGRPGSNLDSVRSEARIARANAEAFVSRIAAEPGTPPDRANLTSEILVSSHVFIRAVMALESDLYRARHLPLKPAALDFLEKTDETILAITHALRNSTPLPHDLPDLRAAHNLMEDHYKLFTIEADRIVTSLNTLREHVAKLLHA